MFQVSGGSFQAGPKGPLMSWMLLNLLKHFLEKNNWCTGKMVPRIRRCLIFVWFWIFNLRFSQVEMASSSPVFWGLQFQKHPLETTAWMRGETKSALNGRLQMQYNISPMGWLYQSAFSYNLSSRFSVKETENTTTLPVFKPSKTNSKKKPLNKNQTTANNGDSIYLKVLGVFSGGLPKKNTIQPG